MSYTPTQLAALKAALAAGTTRVSYDGKSVEYRSLSEIKEIIALIEAELSGAARAAGPSDSSTPLGNDGAAAWPAHL